ICTVTACETTVRCSLTAVWRTLSALKL
ncbi:tonB-dependent Receptor Plug domain protein, partial [Vibrio parahaemolyticus V-223/04]